MKDFIITVVAILGIVAVILVVIAIGNNVSLRPSMLLTSEACDAPCWYGIQPGVTKPQEAYDILSEIDVITNKSIYGDYERDGTVTSWYWFFKRPASDGGGTVYFSDDRATAISLLTANSLKLEDLIEKFGEPEQYWTEIGYGEDREYLEISLFYPVKGIAATLVIDIEGDLKQVEIKSSSPLMRVTFFDPSLLDDLLETNILIDTPQTARTGSFNPWRGYGAITYDVE